MDRFLLAWILVGLPSGPAAQVESPAMVEACRAIDVRIATATPSLRAGSRPQFSLALTNRSSRSTRVLDVRNGRRNDLQDVYFELFVVQGVRIVDLPTVISDPGPIADTDYAALKPGERMDVRPLSYKRMLERLPEGEYSAFVLFWQNPAEPHTSRCRSSDIRFVVLK